MEQHVQRSNEARHVWTKWRASKVEVLKGEGGIDNTEGWGWWGWVRSQRVRSHIKDLKDDEKPLGLKPEWQKSNFHWKQKLLWLQHREWARASFPAESLVSNARIIDVSMILIPLVSGVAKGPPTSLGQLPPPWAPSVHVSQWTMQILFSRCCDVKRVGKHSVREYKCECWETY